MNRTGKAIKALRLKLGDSQHAFAKRLQTTITTISRYENGHFEPSEEVLKKLADLAGSAGHAHLRDAFESQRDAAIIARVENLPSAGSQRRIPVGDLKRWEAMPRFAAERLDDCRQTFIDIAARYPLSGTDRQLFENTCRILGAVRRNVLLDLSRQIEPYINEPKKEVKE